MAGPARRSLAKLPKAHLHLHFTGSLRPGTLMEMASAKGLRIPPGLIDGEPLTVEASKRGWFRFQRAYDAARAAVKTPSDLRRVVKEAARDDAAEGSGRLEIQVDPTSYAAGAGGLTPALETILEAARTAEASTGVSIGIIVAASRMRHPLEARTLARLAARYAGDGPGQVIGFGLSNDERAGSTADFGAAFRIARRAGLAGVPHGGELLGPEHLRSVIAHLKPARIGHGVRSAEDPWLLERIADSGTALEVCPHSNIRLGVYEGPAQVPLRKIFDSGAKIALAADDPLLFHSRLNDQYRLARDVHGFDDAELAQLARGSILASLAPQSVKDRLLAGVDSWLSSTPPG